MSSLTVPQDRLLITSGPDSPPMKFLKVSFIDFTESKEANNKMILQKLKLK